MNTCIYCEKESKKVKAVAKSLCMKHYQRDRRHGDPKFTKITKMESANCIYCEKEGKEVKSFARSLCSKHYERERKYGNPATIK